VDAEVGGFGLQCDGVEFDDFGADDSGGSEGPYCDACAVDAGSLQVNSYHGPSQSSGTQQIGFIVLFRCMHL